VVHQGVRASAAAKLDLRQHDRAAQFVARVVSQVEALEAVNAVPQIKIPQNADDPLDLRCPKFSGDDDAKPGGVEFHQPESKPGVVVEHLLKRAQAAVESGRFGADADVANVHYFL